MRRTLCTICALRLADAYDVRKIVGKTEKITCDECKRRRYGGAYLIEKKEDKKP